MSTKNLLATAPDFHGCVEGFRGGLSSRGTTSGRPASGQRSQAGWGEYLSAALMTLGLLLAWLI